jgi:hypothetical protein
VTTHSNASRILIWKCLWCRERRGQPTAHDVQRLTAFVELHGWNMQPLVLHEDGGVRLAYAVGDGKRAINSTLPMRTLPDKA